MSLASNHW